MASNLYNELIDDLGSEDKDNYVYLDSEGRRETKCDITIKWNKLPKKHFLLTINSNSPTRFLLTRITETMQKYSIFSSLKSLEVQNLRCMNTQIDLVISIQKKNISDLLLIGNEVTFDIDSSDIWLDMRIECCELSLVLIFELKVEKNLECLKLKTQLLRIINMILKAKNLNFMYEVEDIKMIKASMNEEVVIVKDLRSSALDSKRVPKRVCEVKDQRLIKQEFDYLDRFLICSLSRGIGKGDVFQRRMTINPNTSDIVANAFESLGESLLCRGIRMEHFVPVKHMEVKVHKGGDDVMTKQSCCKCEIF